MTLLFWSFSCAYHGFDFILHGFREGERQERREERERGDRLRVHSFTKVVTVATMNEKKRGIIFYGNGTSWPSTEVD